MTILELQQITIDMLADGCLRAGLIKNRDDIKKYYFHSVSHSIGLDCHDPNDRKKPLPEGAVISDEPGLYFPEHKIGVRIEDDLLIFRVHNKRSERNRRLHGFSQRVIFIFTV